MDRVVFSMGLVCCLSLSPYRSFYFSTFFEFVVSSKDIEVDDFKVEAIFNWFTPTSVGQVRSFYGLIDFYRHFHNFFIIIACPLNKLT
jgi:hypothetical protein